MNRDEIERVFIKDSDGEEIKGLHIMSISPQPRARMISHPIESGGVVFDNKVIEPITLEVRCYVDEMETTNRLYELYRERSFKFCEIQSREGVYSNMALIACPHQESSERVDVFEFTLSFQEVMFGTSQFAKPSDAANSPTKRSGRVGGGLGY